MYTDSDYRRDTEYLNQLSDVTINFGCGEMNRLSSGQHAKETHQYVNYCDVMHVPTAVEAMARCTIVCKLCSVPFPVRIGHLSLTIVRRDKQTSYFKLNAWKPVILMSFLVLSYFWSALGVAIS
jgi:hypothetical protein